MEQENKEINASVVFVENTDIPQIENEMQKTTDNQQNLEKVETLASENNSTDTEKVTEAPIEKNDKPIIEHKKTSGVASYVSVPEITITPENKNIKNISTIAVFDYLMAVVIILLFAKTSVKFKTEKIIKKIFTPIVNHTFLFGISCFILVSGMFLKSDFFNIGLQGKLSFGVNFLFIAFVNITAILMGIYTAKFIRDKSKKISKIAGEKFAILGLNVFNVIAILLFFITESLFGLVLSFILTFITCIIFFTGKDNETVEKICKLLPFIILFQIMILGIFLKSSSIVILFCLLFTNTFFNKRI